MKWILRILIVVSMGFGIILLIPPLAEPILNGIDLIFGSEFNNFFSAFYDMIPERIMTLFVMQISTLAIIILVRFVFGGKKR